MAAMRPLTDEVIAVDPEAFLMGDVVDRFVERFWKRLWYDRPV